MPAMMATIEVKRGSGESTTSLMRRFSKLVQSANVVRGAKKRRYAVRKTSEYTKKKSALKRIAKRTENERLRRLGKISDAPYKKFGRQSAR